MHNSLLNLKICLTQQKCTVFVATSEYLVVSSALELSFGTCSASILSTAQAKNSNTHTSISPFGVFHRSQYAHKAK